MIIIVIDAAFKYDPKQTPVPLYMTDSRFCMRAGAPSGQIGTSESQAAHGERPGAAVKTNKKARDLGPGLCILSFMNRTD